MVGWDGTGGGVRACAMPGHMCGCGQLAETAGAGLPPGRPLGDAHGRWGRRLQTGGCVRWAGKFELGAVCKRRAAGRAGARRPCKASPWCGAAADLPGSRGQVQREGGGAGWENIREAASCWRGRRARMRRTGCVDSSRELGAGVGCTARCAPVSSRRGAGQGFNAGPDEHAQHGHCTSRYGGIDPCFGCRSDRYSQCQCGLQHRCQCTRPRRATC